VSTEALEDIPSLGRVVGLVLDIDEEGFSGAGRVCGGAAGDEGCRGGGGARWGWGWRGGGRTGGEEELDVRDEVVVVVGREGEDCMGESYSAGGINQLVVTHDGGLEGRGQLRLEEKDVREHAVEASDGGIVGQGGLAGQRRGVQHVAGTEHAGAGVDAGGDEVPQLGL